MNGDSSDCDVIDDDIIVELCIKGVEWNHFICTARNGGGYHVATISKCTRKDCPGDSYVFLECCWHRGPGKMAQWLDEMKAVSTFPEIAPYCIAPECVFVGEHTRMVTAISRAGTDVFDITNTANASERRPFAGQLLRFLFKALRTFKNASMVDMLGDLKPENLLFMGTAVSDAKPTDFRLIDFGRVPDTHDGLKACSLGYKHPLRSERNDACDRDVLFSIIVTYFTVVYRVNPLDEGRIHELEHEKHALDTDLYELFNMISNTSIKTVDMEYLSKIIMGESYKNGTIQFD